MVEDEQDRSQTRGGRSFAAQHRGLARGGRYVPRWWRETPLWKSLSGEQRAVVDELYHSIAHRDTTHRASGLEVKRGQWLTSYEALAKASGTSYAVARKAIQKLVTAHNALAEKVAYRAGHRTQHLLRITWLDFDAYEWPDTDAAHDAAHNGAHDGAQQKEHSKATPMNEHSASSSTAAAAGGLDEDALADLVEALADAGVGEADRRGVAVDALRRDLDPGDIERMATECVRPGVVNPVGLLVHKIRSGDRPRGAKPKPKGRPVDSDWTGIGEAKRL